MKRHLDMSSDQFYKALGSRICSARRRLMTQEALAKRAALTRTSITNIERGKQKVLTHTLVQIAKALKIDVAELLRDLPAVTLTVEQAVSKVSKRDRALVNSFLAKAK